MIIRLSLILMQVDTDAEMLKYIKDAYESWTSTPGMVDGINKHIKTGIH